jgi:hypothetical protein
MFGPAYTPAPTWSPGEADFLFAVHAAFHDDPLARDHPDEVLVDWGRTTCGMLRAAQRDDNRDKEVIAELTNEGPTAGAPYSDVRLFVHASVAYLCPDLGI